MNCEFEHILRYVNKIHGFYFSPERYSSLERKVNERMAAVNTSDAKGYIRYVQGHPEELNKLIDLLTVNVSRFFRNPLTFEYIAKRTLPEILAEKIKNGDHSLRVWSAGCATGEEPYSIAIIINEIMGKQHDAFDVNIFATDINRKILQQAREGRYCFDKVENIKYGLLNKYFIIQEDDYVLTPAIKKTVRFSFYDIIDPKTYVPPDSVFGGFDLVLCRNMLIYFQAEHQEVIFSKLYRSLAGGGYLVLGDSEIVPVKYEKKICSEASYCHIYRKCP